MIKLDSKDDQVRGGRALGQKEQYVSGPEPRGNWCGGDTEKLVWPELRDGR